MTAALPETQVPLTFTAIPHQPGTRNLQVAFASTIGISQTDSPGSLTRPQSAVGRFARERPEYSTNIAFLFCQDLSFNPVDGKMYALCYGRYQTGTPPRPGQSGTLVTHTGAIMMSAPITEQGGIREWTRIGNWLNVNPFASGQLQYDMMTAYGNRIYLAKKAAGATLTLHAFTIPTGNDEPAAMTGDNRAIDTSGFGYVYKAEVKGPWNVIADSQKAAVISGREIIPSVANEWGVVPFTTTGAEYAGNPKPDPIVPMSAVYISDRIEPVVAWSPNPGALVIDHPGGRLSPVGEIVESIGGQAVFALATTAAQFNLESTEHRVVVKFESREHSPAIALYDKNDEITEQSRPQRIETVRAAALDLPQEIITAERVFAGSREYGRFELVGLRQEGQVVEMDLRAEI